MTRRGWRRLPRMGVATLTHAGTFEPDINGKIATSRLRPVFEPDIAGRNGWIEGRFEPDIAGGNAESRPRVVSNRISRAGMAGSRAERERGEPSYLAFSGVISGTCDGRATVATLSG
jgi:hypothetical protein